MQKSKVAQLFTSIRFWIVTLTMIVAVLEGFVSGEEIQFFFDTIQLYLVAVVGIGTADSIATKFGGSGSNANNYPSRNTD